MSCGGSLSQKWLHMVKLFNIKSSWNHAYACLLAGNNMCKKTTHVPLHITGSRAEPYTPEISADSIRALLLACWPGAVLNSFWTLDKLKRRTPCIFHQTHRVRPRAAHSMDGSSQSKGNFFGSVSGVPTTSQLWLPYPPSIGGPPAGILAILPARLAGNSWKWWSFHLPSGNLT